MVALVFQPWCAAVAGDCSVCCSPVGHPLGRKLTRNRSRLRKVGVISSRGRSLATRWRAVRTSASWTASPSTGGRRQRPWAVGCAGRVGSRSGGPASLGVGRLRLGTRCSRRAAGLRGSRLAQCQAHSCSLGAGRLLRGSRVAVLLGAGRLLRVRGPGTLAICWGDVVSPRASVSRGPAGGFGSGCRSPIALASRVLDPQGYGDGPDRDCFVNKSNGQQA